MTVFFTHDPEGDGRVQMAVAVAGLNANTEQATHQSLLYREYLLLVRRVIGCR